MQRPERQSVQISTCSYGGSTNETHLRADKCASRSGWSLELHWWTSCSEMWWWWVNRVMWLWWAVAVVPMPDLKEHHLEQLRFVVSCFQLQFGSSLLTGPKLQRPKRNKLHSFLWVIIVCVFEDQWWFFGPIFSFYVFICFSTLFLSLADLADQVMRPAKCLFGLFTRKLIYLTNIFILERKASVA